MHFNEFSIILLIKIGISLGVIIFFLFFYYKNFVFTRSLLWQSKSFFFGVLSSSGVILLQMVIPFSSDPLFTAFVKAALVEETVRYLVLYLRIHFSSEGFSVTEGIFDAIMIGLGFAFAENLHYSVSDSGLAVLMRNVSAVPMHLISSGIMGFFLSYFHLSRKKMAGGPFFHQRRVTLPVMAFIFPVIYHGVYDYFLIRSGLWNYMIPVVLLSGFGYLQYLSARGKVIFSKNLLQALDIDADELEILFQQKLYEKWINDISTWENRKISILVPGWNLFNTVAGIGAISLGVVLWYIDRVYPEMMFKSAGISQEARFSLLLLLPVSIGSIFIASEKLNFLFFRDFFMHLPVGSVAEIISDDDEKSDAIVMDVFATGVFLTARYDLCSGDKRTLMLLSPNGKEIEVKGNIIWSNAENKSLPLGAIFRYRKIGFDLLLFRTRHIFNRFKRRLQFTREL